MQIKVCTKARVPEFKLRDFSKAARALGPQMEDRREGPSGQRPTEKPQPGSFPPYPLSHHTHIRGKSRAGQLFHPSPSREMYWIVAGNFLFIYLKILLDYFNYDQLFTFFFILNYFKLGKKKKKRMDLNLGSTMTIRNIPVATQFKRSYSLRRKIRKTFSQRDDTAL